MGNVLGYLKTYKSQSRYWKSSRRRSSHFIMHFNCQWLPTVIVLALLSTAFGGPIPSESTTTTPPPSKFSPPTLVGKFEPTDSTKPFLVHTGYTIPEHTTMFKTPSGFAHVNPDGNVVPKFQGLVNYPNKYRVGSAFQKEKNGEWRYYKSGEVPEHVIKSDLATSLRNA